MFAHFKFLLRYGWKELRNNRFFSAFFTINLILGLVGFIFLGNFRIAVDEYFDVNLKKTLNADVQVFSRQLLPEGLLEELTPILSKYDGSFQTTEVVSLFSMVKSSEQTVLFNIRAIDAQFNLYTDFEIENRQVQSNDIEEKLAAQKGLWLNPDAMTLLQVKEGDRLSLGNTSFVINAVVSKMPQMGVGFSAFVPTVYISRQHIQDTGLIQFGSRLLNNINIGFADQSLASQMPELKAEIKTHLKSLYGDNYLLRVRSLQDASDRLSALLDYLSGFLGLIALVALFLSGVGSVFLFRNYAIKRLRVTTISLCLGLTTRDSLIIMLIQLLILAVVAFVGAMLLGAGLSYLSTAYFSGIMDDFSPALYDFSTLLGGFLIAVIASVLFSVPTLLSVRNVKPITLIKESYQPESFGTSQGRSGIWKRVTNFFKGIAIYLPGMVFFLAIAIYLTSVIRGSIFMLILILALSVLFLCVFSVCVLANKSSVYAKGIYKVALRNIARNKNTTASSSIAIALGVFLIAIIPQITQGMKQEIQQPEGSALPSYFLIDIQDDQIEQVRKFVKNSGYSLNFESPMIRGRLIRVNDEEIRPLEEDEDSDMNSNWGRRRGFNLTYRSDLYPSEQLIKGRALSKEYEFGQPAEISIEEDFAKDNHFYIGDTLIFDIQGVEVETRVVNLRSVKWNSFQPNFFVSVQEGVLEQAPKVFIANIKGIRNEDKVRFRRELIKNFPNITAIDVAEIIESTIELGGKVLGLVLFLAVIAIFSGLLVVFSIAIMQTYQKRKELALLKILGSSSQKLRHYIMVEFVAPGVFSLSIGVFLSLIASWAFSYMIFNRFFSIDWYSIGYIMLAATTIIVLLSVGITAYVSHFKPLENIKTE